MNAIPDLARIRQIDLELGLGLDAEALDACSRELTQTLEAYERVARLSCAMAPPPVARPYIRPAPADNRLNAWFVKSNIKGATEGKLAGKFVAVKDNICVAGIPMLNGSTVLNGFIPDTDATVVKRLLDAGATIAGKSHCEFYCTSGGSHTNATGVVRNPHNPSRSAGGSSSGSAVLLATGEVDLALGTDQGGSVRIPGAYTGVVGMKPTWGLVPYTGAMPIEATVDHIGPMSCKVADNALMLEVLAGPDGLDPRQSAAAVPDRYTEDLELGVRGLRIAVVKEGFGWDNSEADVDEAVMSAAETFAKLGAHVEQVSIPLHRNGIDIWTPIINEGGVNQMMRGNGFGFNWKGQYQLDLWRAQSRWREQAAQLAPTVKMTMLAGEYALRSGGGIHYAMAQNLSRLLRDAYDSSLREFDVLLMPTLPMKATPLPPDDAPLETIFRRAWEMLANTAPFDVTGHPALQLPCAMRAGLPVGLMLVGRHFGERTLYRIGAAFERAADWTRS